MLISGEFPNNSQEASSIPHLLVAPKSGPHLPPSHDDPDAPVDRTIYEDGQGDARGYYHDGAYTAAPDLDSAAAPPTAIATGTTATATHGPNDPQPSSCPSSTAEALAAAYFAALSARFLALRRRLHQPPPAAALAALGPTSSPAVGRFGPASRTFAVWSARLRDLDPRPAQVAAMRKDAALRVLRVLLGGRAFLRRGAPLAERTSRWLWALLARLPDRGEMDHAEVGHVRELGKRAALLLWSLREMDRLREEVEGEGAGYGEDEDEDEDGGVDGDEGELVLGPHADGVGEDAWLGGDDDDHDNGDEGESSERRETQRDAEQQPESAPTAKLNDNAPEQPVQPSSIAPASLSDKDEDDGMEDGEIADTPAPMDVEPGPAAEQALEAARARLLAQLNDDGDTPKHHADGGGGAATGELAGGEEPRRREKGEQEEPLDDPVRARMNARATLNMILTVAGEFYGQRDLLEFRDPFHGV